MMRIKINIRGETLAETIVALSVLAIGITVASTVILNSMRNLTNAKNRVIAINIAREGIEAVRNIRDTNWLYYSDKRRQCWNHDPGAGVCDGTNPIPPGVYIVYKHAPEGSWRLQLADENVLVDSDLDGIPGNDLDLTDLSLADIDNLNVDSDGDGDPANDPDFYNHMKAGVASPIGTFVRPAPFTRYIVIEYLENQPAALNPSIDTLIEWTAASKDELNRMRVTSVVGWERGASHTVELKTIITDHLGREDLES
ncbi:MAG: hypothetical protein V1880_02510 [Patescibacteria group bacterium]